MKLDGFAVRRYRILEIFHLHVEVGQVYEGNFYRSVAGRALS